MRCQSILLKSEGRTSKDVGSITGMCNVSVDTWVKRYKSEGFPGLITKFVRGRKPIIEGHDTDAILSAIKANRQRMQTAKRDGSDKAARKYVIILSKVFEKAWRTI
jgi:transposase